ncbi:HD-GYP domain-containing protein [Methylococcus sp. EFPC2]|uniref:HD-GYP domain-containing protein n=1 Tax=Methylococcus sp. EFPC2 TaxID=2812648 RepID=UPI001967CCCC|nr:HD domain-containing phosphohydrolase [Methylococcus sp. EFPC2]QSA96133.1 HD domain-containing protein [Methylococcus sp. EFPC2]
MSKNTAPLRDAFIETVRLLVKATEYRDEQTGGHIERTSYYCKHLAAALGADREFQDRIFFAAPMHDVGKIGIPDAILLKPGTLHGEELAIMRSHAELGEHMLSAGSSPYLQMGMTVAGGHHERWDGSGYPRGLKGEEIPLPARIMAVADIYDALRSRRPYKAAIDHETTVDIIRKGDGRTLPGHFDPEIMSVFSKEASAFKDIYDSYS